MRRVLLLIISTLVLCWAGLLLSLQAGRHTVQGLTARLRADAMDSPEYWHREWQRLGILARERAIIYDHLIETEHLENLMVVHRHFDGRPSGECDSLLFSSLRYTALVKLGWQDKAARAWRGIEGAFQHGRWVRHPKCRRKSTSRDMIVGLLVALTQDPPGQDRRLQQLFDIVVDTGGSVDDGPFYVSRLSPGIGEILRQMSSERGFPSRELPEEIRLGFSTLELDTWMAAPGYTAHLNGLTLWTELELNKKLRHVPMRSLAGLFDGALGPLGSPRLEDQRWEWVAQKLAALDRQNLFFAWLQLRSAGALTWKSQAMLLDRLLAMPQFPAQRLPRNCDRSADYLWQRSSSEYGRNPKAACTETFHGVDFLWMTALLTENL